MHARLNVTQEYTYVACMKLVKLAYIPKKYFPAGFANAEVEAQLLVHQILILLFVAFPEAATRWYNGSAEVLTCL